jgi:hypothetical protein
MEGQVKVEDVHGDVGAFVDTMKHHHPSKASGDADKPVQQATEEVIEQAGFAALLRQVLVFLFLITPCRYHRKLYPNPEGLVRVLRQNVCIRGCYWILCRLA